MRLLILLLIFCTPLAIAQTRVPFQLTAYDSPFNHENGFAFPSMNQSMDLTVSFYNAAHLGLDKLAKKYDHRPSIYETVFDLIWLPLPLGTSWLHEEYHRAVLSHQGINSHNDVYNWTYSDVIAVSEVSDEELAKFKDQDNPSFVRMSAAGMEAQTQMNLRLDQDMFFKNAPINQFNQLINAINNTAYMNACITSDDHIDKLIKQDGPDVSKRDFTGFDCLAWTYDLHRPDDAYAARGPHPSGVGIDRYIKYSDLTRKEKDYLILNANLSFLNFISPMMFGFRKFKSGESTWNFSLAHYMSSFGHDIDVNTFFKTDEHKYQLTLHNYFNGKGYSPGLEGILFDQKLRGKLLGDLRLMLWDQPQGQRFDSSVSSLGGLVSTMVKYNYQQDHYPFIEFSQKTQGWVAGNVYLDPNFSTRIGYLYIY